MSDVDAMWPSCGDLMGCLEYTRDMNEFCLVARMDVERLRKVSKAMSLLSLGCLTYVCYCRRSK